MKQKYIDSLDDLKIKNYTGKYFHGDTPKGQYNEGIDKAKELFMKMFMGNEMLEKAVEAEMEIRDLQIIKLQNQLNEAHYSFKEACHEE